MRKVIKNSIMIVTIINLNHESDINPFFNSCQTVEGE